MNSPLTDIEKKERLQRAKNKFQLIRRQLNNQKANKHKLLALVQELASQRPDVTVKILKNWIDTSR